MKDITRKKGFREFLRVTLALAIGLTLGFIITLFVSDNPIEAYKQFLTGPLSRLNRIGDWIEESLTLILLGLSLTIVFSAGQAYIGVEGQMIMGAVAAGVFVLNVPLPPFLRIALAFVVASLAGFLWAVIPALLKAYLNASELVASLMLNTIALKLFGYLLRYHIMPEGHRSLSSEYIPEEFRLPSFIPDLPFLSTIREAWVANTSVSVIVYIIIAAVIAVYLLLYKTPLGYELRTVGSNPKFARYAGINIKRTVFLAMTLSGITAGIAGTHLVLAINNRLVDAMGLGIGFEGVNISTLARGNPLLVPLVSFLYGYMRAGAEVMERTTDVSRELVIVIQAVILLMVTAERLMPTIQQRINDKDENGKINNDSDELEMI
jgi:simple sugar transport system permease protein